MKRQQYYHVFNRGNNKQNIFFSDRNYRHFLYLTNKYLKDHIRLLAYCLMPNHFHLFIQVKENPELDDEELRYTMSRQFRLLFMSFSKGINHEQERTGSLFQKNFKKIPVTNDDYFTSLIAYIHLNPVRAKLVSNCHEWPHSSYNSMIELSETKIARNEVLNWFGGRSRFINFHEEYLNLPSL